MITCQFLTLWDGNGKFQKALPEFGTGTGKAMSKFIYKKFHTNKQISQSTFFLIPAQLIEVKAFAVWSSMKPSNHPLTL